MLPRPFYIASANHNINLIAISLTMATFCDNHSVFKVVSQLIEQIISGLGSSML